MALYYGMNPLLKRLDMTRDSKITQFYLPPTHEPYTCLYSPAARHHRRLAGIHYAYARRDGQAELTCVTGYILR